jgi:tetratricopeptide (TPR) repeat protein
MMKAIIQLIVLFSMVCLTTGWAHAKGAGIEWGILSQEVITLYRAGQYARAVKVAEAALAVAEKNVGPNHPDVATSLNNLAALYRTQGDYAKAEPLYKRSLAIREKVLGPEHPDVATILNNLAKLYRATNQSEEAAKLETRALIIRAIKR